VNFKSP